MSAATHILSDPETGFLLRPAIERIHEPGAEAIMAATSGAPRSRRSTAFAS
jgi:hypothetical protein